MAARGSARHAAALGLAGLCALGVLAFPENNWDLVPYVALALGPAEPYELHRETYAEVRRGVPETTWRQLEGEEGGYRDAVRSDPRTLAAQLPFYESKILYVLTLKLFAATGLDLVRATHLVGALSLFAFLYLSYRWLRSFASVPVALSGELLIAGMAFGTAAQSTPDMLAAALMLGAYLSAVRNRTLGARLLGLVALTSLAVATRPDAIAWAGFLLLAHLVQGFPAPKRTVALAILPGIVFLAVVAVTRPYGWSTVFYHSFVEKLADPSVVAAEVGLPLYLEVIARNLVSLRWSYLLPCLFVGLFGALLARRDSERARIVRRLVAVAAAASAVHYLAHPELADRFFLAHEVTLLVAGVALLLDRGNDGTGAEQHGGGGPSP